MNTLKRGEIEWKVNKRGRLIPDRNKQSPNKVRKGKLGGEIGND